MLRLERGIVKNILYEDSELQILNVEVNGFEKAVNYKKYTGCCKSGDGVILNTIAVRLGLGSGGYHFVYLNLNNSEEVIKEGHEKGHIIKMKYTPGQLRVKTLEEYEDNKDILNTKQNLLGKPVIVTTLHSMVCSIAASIKFRDKNKKIACIYTYGGAVNACFSKTLKELKNKYILDSVITCGECFGGDYEAINIYSALVFAYKKLNCDIVIITCGPGIAGTRCYYGFSTLEMIMPLYASKDLNLIPILSPRISFSDKRKRHFGISMQTMAILKCLDFKVYVPICNSDRVEYIKKQISESELNSEIEIKYVNDSCAREAFEKYKLTGSVMGRGYSEDTYFFDNCSGVGVFAAKI